MNPERFFMPRYMGFNGARFSNSALGTISSIPRNAGIFSKITSGIRSVNWGGFLNNANKTLNVVNQAIPLVRQAGPMVNNMKSMLKLAKVFGNETTTRSKVNNFTSDKVLPTKSNDNNVIINNEKKEVVDDNSLNFFI